MARPLSKIGERKRKAIALHTEENLTPTMKHRRDAFIAEYLVDWSGPMAWIRSGGSPSNAPRGSYNFLHEPYVAKKIKEVVDALEETQIINRNRVLAGLVKEANYAGVGASHGARVSAYSALAKIIGMEAPTEIDVRHTGGVMMVPFTPSVNDWERSAIEVQALLKSDVRK